MQKRRTTHVTVLRQTKNCSKKSKVSPKVRPEHDDTTWTIPSATSQLTTVMVPAKPTVNSDRLQRVSPLRAPVKERHKRQRKESRRGKPATKNRWLKAWIVVLMVLLVASGVAVGIYFLVRVTTKTTTLPPNQYSEQNVELRWNPVGVTVSGADVAGGSNASRLDQPLDIAIEYLNTLYIAEYGRHRVQQWSVGGSIGRIIAGRLNASAGNSSGDLSNPNGLYVDSSGNVYVADGANSRVQLWNNGSFTGTTVAGTGVAGSAQNQLRNPYGLAMDSNTRTLFITDSNNHRVMAYANGATTGTMVAGRNISGSNNTLLCNPTGLYFDSITNSILIANFGCHNIVRWMLGATSGTLLAGSIDGSPGNSSGMLFSPRSVTLDPMGNMYVADSQNSRIQLFLAGQREGRTIAGISTVSGSNTSQLSLPCAVRLDAQLNLFVADTGNNRVQRFSRY